MSILNILNFTSQPQKRRSFVKTVLLSVAAITLPGRSGSQEKPKKKSGWVYDNGYDATEHLWGMGVNIDDCIGCGRCVASCKEENNVPKLPFFFRTWVERYEIEANGRVSVSSPNGGYDSFKPEISDKQTIRSFFVPKLCNHCDNPPCVQVCPVGATFKTVDGVILVDKDYCIGCRYCIQACPYGARFLHPVTRTAEKCTFCYHRITKGMSPACVENCPTQARIFGELKKGASPLVRFKRMHNINVLKPNLNTEPKVYYANLDMEVS
ncbi:MAG: 4Fe-4S dicluster domain-containing protein [Chlorobi bacterium]|nr:4Fe-4S dicluster domain-containing protein [Chlorobiota bacterium]